MKNFKYVIKDEIGIHARPAGLLVKEAGKFQSAITLKSGAKSGDAKRIFGIMGMAVKQNDEVTVEADGADEDEAIAALKKFFEENL
ncbi:phosphocarrier protein [Lachnotalea glycerini]|jgi:phosphocarrier protein HPr|uniref:Phosphocarrier protein n=1 Tax=Lachnotalea glycerini TaxID=1763509 RepID=A0A318EMG2_9FIRM|nr:HPr family phosphocarrier protein [Lachnotalea glycerini]PXV89037.1 phosphocarrier protein [Lachnotalea glycerini]RDY31509.1 HPr family phosphocarrier protein [Lachnotalea glycerini]